MANYPTPHIDATPADFAKTVLMPGDPLRARFIAEQYLEDAKLVNNVRGVQGYTGLYRGKRVSVMASGMGMPSIGIYSYELFHFFDVDRIIRIGSAGSLQDHVKARELVFALGAATDSNYTRQYGLPGEFAPTASYDLLKAAVTRAESAGARFHVGNVLSTDVFYHHDPTDNGRWRGMGILAVEMEAAALYMNAAACGKSALAMFTVSDEIFGTTVLSAAERETSFREMMEIALDTAISFSGD